MRVFEGSKCSNVQLKSQILGTLFEWSKAFCSNVSSGLDFLTFLDSLALS